MELHKSSKQSTFAKGCLGVISMLNSDEMTTTNSRSLGLCRSIAQVPSAWNCLFLRIGDEGCCGLNRGE